MAPEFIHVRALGDGVGGGLGSQQADLSWPLPGMGGGPLLKGAPPAAEAVLVSAGAVRRLLLHGVGATCWAYFPRTVFCFVLAAACPIPARFLGDYFIGAVAEARPAPSRLDFEDAYCQVSKPFAEPDPERLQHWNEKEEDRGDDFRAGQIRSNS